MTYMSQLWLLRVDLSVTSHTPSLCVDGVQATIVSDRLFLLMNLLLIVQLDVTSGQCCEANVVGVM